jgi:hypothetical protein
VSYADRLLDQLHRVDAAMVARGNPAIPPAWWHQIERFYHSGKRQFTVRKPRRIGASTVVAPRLIVASLLCSEHRVPEGETSIFAVVSVKRSEASNRLRNTKAVLDALAIPYQERDGELEVTGTNRVIKVLTASFRTEVGQTLEFLWCDELSRWRDDTTGANPAREVLAALKPSLATVRDGRIWLVSSPLGREDFHAREYERGDDEDQIVADLGCTWEVNPTLSEADCRALERDPKIFGREYRGIPQDAASPAFEAEHVDRSFLAEYPSSGTYGRPIVCIDASAGGSCQFVWCLAAWYFPAPGVGRILASTLGRGFYLDESGRAVDPSDYETRPDEQLTEICGKPTSLFVSDAHGYAIRKSGVARAAPVLVVSDLHAISNWRGQVEQDQIVSDIAAFALPRGARLVVGDQFGSAGLHSDFKRYGLQFEPLSPAPTRKAEGVVRLRQFLADRQFATIAKYTELRTQLRRYQEIITPSGTVRYSGKRAGLDDQADCVIAAARADVAGLVPASPIRNLTTSTVSVRALPGFSDSN